MRHKIIVLILALVTLFSCEEEESTRPSYHKEVLSYSFKAADNQVLSEDVIGEVDMETKTLTATLPYGTDLTALIPSFEVAKGAKVIPPGEGPQDFTNPVEYRVQAADGSVFVYKCVAELSSGSGLFMKSFIVDGNEGVINDADNTVSARVNYGKYWDNIAPIITLAEGATVYPESGVAQDFTNPVEYTVTTSKGLTKTYIVTVTGTAIEGRFAEGHENYTIVNYWPEKISTAWQVNFATLFIDGVAQSDRLIFNHEQKDPATGVLLSGVAELSDIDGTQIGEKWDARFDDGEDAMFENQYLMWSKGIYSDKWSNSLKKTFEIEKAVFVNDLGFEFDITRQTAGEYMPIMLVYIYDAEYTLKVWYTEVGVTTGERVKSYREMHFSSFYNISITKLYQADEGEITKECIRMDIAHWNELSGWIFGNGDPEVGATEYGRNEYLAEGVGRGWYITEGDHREYRIDHEAKP